MKKLSLAGALVLVALSTGWSRPQTSVFPPPLLRAQSQPAPVPAALPGQLDTARGMESVESTKTLSQPTLDCDSNYARGDLNRDSVRDLADIVQLVDCVFSLESGPSCLVCVGDMNCDQDLSPADIIILMRLYFFEITADIRCPKN